MPLLNSLNRVPGVVQGYVAPGFEEVRHEFERNFASGASSAPRAPRTSDGEKVVDLWGGVRDARNGEPWEEDTLVLVYSTSKGLAAMTLALAHSRGWLDYDERVATYWPEFAQAGKGEVTVRQLLAHEAGLPVVDEPLDPQPARRLRPPGGRHRPPAPALEAGHAPRLPRREPRLVRGRAGAARGPRAPHARPLLRRGDRGAARARHLLRGAGGRAARAARADRARPAVEGAARRLRDLPPPMALAMANPRSLTFRTFANPRLRSPA